MYVLGTYRKELHCGYMDPERRVQKEDSRRPVVGRLPKRDRAQGVEEHVQVGSDRLQVDITQVHKRYCH